jgi:hypothetical protein
MAQYKLFWLENKALVLKNHTYSGEIAPDSSPNITSGIDPALCSTKCQPRGLVCKIDQEALDKPPTAPQLAIGKFSNEPRTQRAVPP